MHRITRATVAAGAAALALGVLSMAPAEAQTKYANCTALHHDFEHGVARSRTAADKQVRAGYGRPAYGKHARNVYWTNHASLDRDKDGTACEA